MPAMYVGAYFVWNICGMRNRAGGNEMRYAPLYFALLILNILTPETTHIIAQQMRYSVDMVCFVRAICAASAAAAAAKRRRIPGARPTRRVLPDLIDGGAKFPLSQKGG